jgi:hypothetical protein
MDWDDRFDDADTSNLPPEAFQRGSDADGPFEPNSDWLKSAATEQQLIAMRAWFLTRYCDPAMETPYAGREGGYVFVNGGPYFPSDELPARFLGLVDEALINEVVEEMHADVGHRWAPVRHEAPDDYDDRFGLQLLRREEPLQRLQDRLQKAQSVLTLEGDVDAKALAQLLVFGAAISILEAFLWETAHFWVENDDQVLRALVRKLPAFREEKLLLSDIFEKHAGLKMHVLGYLQNLVWHRWEKVVPIYKLGLGIAKLPSFKPFEMALEKRHDIVHRSGHDKDGAPIEVSAGEIGELCEKILGLASEIDEQLKNRNSLALGATASDF